MSRMKRFWISPPTTKTIVTMSAKATKMRLERPGRWLRAGGCLGGGELACDPCMD